MTASWYIHRIKTSLTGALWMLGFGIGFGQTQPPAITVSEPGVTYTNYRVANVPWSIHVVQVDRSIPHLAIHSMHAGNSAVGLGTLSAQMAAIKPEIGVPLAAINGDFYVMERAFTGHPRNLQIIDGDTISAPSGGMVFWTDILGKPNVGKVASHFHVTWPDGTNTPCDLDGERTPGGVELYTPEAGASTHAKGGRELVLERVEENPWLPLRIGKTYTARIRELRTAGDTALTPDTMVLSIGPALKTLSVPAVGAVLHVSTESTPNLAGAKTAIGAGSVLVHEGKKQKIQAKDDGSYEATTMLERHPRTAFGWNAKAYFLVVVDGRQKNLSVGMTLEELATEMLKLGCGEAVSFDGGGSATLWCEGSVRNSPCDGRERAIANSIVFVKQPDNGKVRESGNK